MAAETLETVAVAGVDPGVGLLAFGVGAALFRAWRASRMDPAVVFREG